MQGITPLFIACQEKHVSVARALLKGKADPNRRNKVGFWFIASSARMYMCMCERRARVVGYR